MSLDPYKTLGVDKKANQDTIKKAYRNLARKYHPDVNPGDKGAEEKFKELSMAYDILSDPAKKSEYDNLGKEAFFEKGFGGAGYQTGNFDFSDFRWDDLFADLFGGGSKPRSSRRKNSFAFGGDQVDFSSSFGDFGGRAVQKKGADVVRELNIPFLDAVNGQEMTLRLDLPQQCQQCGGQGLVSQGGGVGQCQACRGQGSVLAKQGIKLRIPPGVSDGQKIRLRGKGWPGQNGGAPGDLNFVIHVLPHEVFTRDGLNLLMEKDVSLYDALLGGSVKVPTPSGHATLKIPAMTQNGAKFRLKGQGITSGKKTGDLYVTVKVTLPTKLTEGARELVEKLAEMAPVS
ncbi:MAG: DnaJ domain-containing protein [Deltaproteobacteria bacterium]|jgi:molecular chaperone DnaJ|nr:DnaJ domain-containing protein [Deltaproteobacteria bacterium]